MELAPPPPRPLRCPRPPHCSCPLRAPARSTGRSRRSRSACASGPMTSRASRPSRSRTSPTLGRASAPPSTPLPNASPARVSYARELLGDVSGAVDAMELAFGAAGTPSDRAWTAYRLGELASGSGDVRTAPRWYERGRDLDPSFVPNLARLAKVAWARGDTELAIRRYEEVVARYPSAEFVIALGDLYRSTGRLDQAAEQDAVVRAMQELAVANGVNVDLELALFDADRGDEAGALEAAEAEWGRRQSVHVADALAWALFANGRYEEAADYADRALDLGTRNALFFFHTGMIRLELGDVAGAREALRDALAIAPHFSILHAANAERALAELEASG